MAQFDVHKNPRGGPYPLLLDIQSNVLARTEHRVVVPMVVRKKYGGRPIAKLNPLVVIGDIEYMLVFQDLASIPPSGLGEHVTSLAARRAELIAAIDFLFTGV